MARQWKSVAPVSVMSNWGDGKVVLGWGLGRNRVAVKSKRRKSGKKKNGKRKNFFERVGFGMSSFFLLFFANERKEGFTLRRVSK